MHGRTARTEHVGQLLTSGGRLLGSSAAVGDVGALGAVLRHLLAVLAFPLFFAIVNVAEAIVIHHEVIRLAAPIYEILVLIVVHEVVHLAVGEGVRRVRESVRP